MSEYAEAEDSMKDFAYKEGIYMEGALGLGTYGGGASEAYC